jgi:hypothetical protein
MFERLRKLLFGSVPQHGQVARRVGTRLIDRIAHGELRTLEDAELMELVDYLLTRSQLRTPLRGNTRFLESVAAQFHRKRAISARQRQGILNILERAYPHNLAAELRRFSAQA